MKQRFWSLSFILRRSLFAIVGLFAMAQTLSTSEVMAFQDEAESNLWDAWLELPGGKLRFDLEWQSENGEPGGYIINGDERLEITYSQTKVSYVFEFRHYESHVEFRQIEDRLEGTWAIRKGDEKWPHFEFGAERVAKRQPPDESGKKFAGRWKVDFEKSDDLSVGVFRFDPKLGLLGTFLTSTGDYRYLQGRKEGDAWTFSCFDGAHAFLFRFKEQDDGTLAGNFWSGDSWHETWVAKRDEDVKLPSGFSVNMWNPNADINSFSFPQVDGVETSLGDEAYQGKVRLIYLFGTWCPNCHDAGEFLKELRDEYGDRGLVVQGLAFELTSDFYRNSEQVRRYWKRHGHEFPVFIAGPADKEKASQAFPLLDRVYSYPTVIFLDEQNHVRAVHAGFSGPATGDAHEKLKKDFRAVIEDILATN